MTISNWIKEYWLRFTRSIQYAVIGWGNHDWDYSYIDSLLLFKLKRVLTCLSNSSVLDLEHEDNKRSIKSLRLAIKLLERIDKEEYCKKELDLAHEEWASSFDKNVAFEIKTDLSTMWKKIRSLLKKEDRLKQRDRKIFYAILFKYQHTWWD